MAEDGPATDAKNEPVFDPSKNVLDLVQEAIRRQDDLRESDSTHVKQLMDLHFRYQAELRQAETARINAIREVDVQAVQRAAEVQATAALALATQVTTTKDTFQASMSLALEPITQAIADLRKTQYEQAGQKAQVVEARDVRGEKRLDTNSLVVFLGLLIAAASFYFSNRPG